MPLVFKDSLYDAQWLRTAGHASSGGADIGECFAAAGQIREPHAESWFNAWSNLGTAVLTEAERSCKAGRRASALAAYLRAANYFRAAYTFLIGAPVDPRVVDEYRRQRAAFESASGLMQPSAERASSFPMPTARCTDIFSARPTTTNDGPP